MSRQMQDSKNLIWQPALAICHIAQSPPQSSIAERCTRAADKPLRYWPMRTPIWPQKTFAKRSRSRKSWWISIEELSD